MCALTAAIIRLYLI